MNTFGKTAAVGLALASLGFAPAALARSAAPGARTLVNRTVPPASASRAYAARFSVPRGGDASGGPSGGPNAGG